MVRPCGTTSVCGNFNTEYRRNSLYHTYHIRRPLNDKKGTQIHNSKQLVESLIRSGFREVSVSKRKITNKILTPYRDENGKFTNDKEKREI